MYSIQYTMEKRVSEMLNVKRDSFCKDGIDMHL